ncbi:MAG: dTMP kinase [Gemmatimonadales bacterium]|nr:MAG: dTMP kinase [Gemmatimonadales bacterium]
MTRGLFVALEGPEGAGKSTLATFLMARLKNSGIAALAVREPGGTGVAEAIRQILLQPGAPLEPASELFLFLAARGDLVARVIRPALQAGQVVLADRYELSTEAYQCGGRGLDRDLFLAANRAATGGLSPDLTLVLDLPAGTGLERVQQAGKVLDRSEAAGLEFHQRVGKVFREAKGSGFVHLDATRPPEQVADGAWEALRSRLAVR